MEQADGRACGAAEVKRHMDVLYYQEVEADTMQRVPARCRR
jgi:hypothetical protein